MRPNLGREGRDPPELGKCPNFHRIVFLKASLSPNFMQAFLNSLREFLLALNLVVLMMCLADLTLKGCILSIGTAPPVPLEEPSAISILALEPSRLVILDGQYGKDKNLAKTVSPITVRLTVD